MEALLNSISDWLIKTSDFVCGYPEFFLLIGGGLFLFIYSGGVSIRRLPWSIRAIRHKQAKQSGKETGQISSLQALMSAIAATVGMGNIAGVAIALTIGGPGVILWMWVSAIVGMSTKFFEGTLSIMYKGHDSNGEIQGGPMYMIINGLGKKFKFMAYMFAGFGLIGTLCFMQANQLVESVTTVFTTPAGIENTLMLRFIMGVIIVVIVGAVILGGIKRIAKFSSRIVPLMVVLYLILVMIIMVINYDKIPAVFSAIFSQAFSMKAGFGAFAYVALTGARRAAYSNEAGVGTASMMHGASQNNDPVREGLIAMIAPAIDSGLVCTLTAIPILIAGNYVGLGSDIKGLYVALGSFGQLLPGIGQYLLMVIVFFFAFSTMFSYSYYGQKCTNFLFGANNAKYYNYFYLIMIIVAAMIPLKTLVSVMDLAFAFMALCTMTTLILLSPRVKKLMKGYFNKDKSVLEE
jgi:AGCS family alanine or glycine:cation symporter